MFTGLIEEIGVISALTPLDSTTSGGNGTSLTITSCPLILSDANLGDSISINGTCLTITELTPPPSSSSPTNIPPVYPPRSSSAAETATLTTLAAAISPLDAGSLAGAAEAQNEPNESAQSNQIGPNGSASAGAFKVGISPETLHRTNLGALQKGDKVNLERALKGEVRMGGHFVQGHVDCVARIVGLREEGNMVVYRFEAVPNTGDSEDGGGDVLRYIVEKGYVALDGASLTVTNVGEKWWEVMLIPYTRERVVMGGKGVGDGVNVEVDMVGKYVERSVRGFLEGRAEGLPGLEEMVRRVVREEVREMGLEEGGRRGLVEG